MKTLSFNWKITMMVVLTALVGALHAAILIPFKLLVIIPGVTEIRPANAIPIACSLMFGPAAAWGAAIGNTIGDVAFGFGPGTLFGMVGNFLFGFAPYALWRAVFGAAVPDARKVSHWAMLVFVTFVASAVCAWTIGWGIDVVIKGVPFGILTSIILVNNFVIAVILAPPLLFALLPRVKAWGLLYTTVMPEEVARRPRFAWLGAVLFTAGSLGGLVVGEDIAWGLHKDPVNVSMFMKQLKSAVAPPKAQSKKALVKTVKTEPPIDFLSIVLSGPPASGTAPFMELANRGWCYAGNWAVHIASPSKTAGLGWGLMPFFAMLLLGILLL